MKKLGKYTYAFEKSVGISSWGNAVGHKEGEGPLGNLFDFVTEDDLLNEKSWESAESQFQKKAVENALKRGGFKKEEVDVIFAGDLLNQCCGSSFGLRELSRPFVGVYGACSTMALSVINASVWVETGIKRAGAVTSSHFCSAERQFRFPLDYGSIRTPSSQWTATASGCVIIEGDATPKIEGFTVGRIVDWSQSDVNNMGAAMAPAGADTISRFFEDTGLSPSEFDYIITGDLGVVGSKLLVSLLKERGLDISENHRDCGKMLFDLNCQDVHAGGSGCGCSASVLTAYFLPRLKEGKINNILFCATGALLSTTSTQQGNSIPCICHAVWIKK